MVTKSDFLWEEELWIQILDLTINVIDHLIFGKSCMHEIDLKIYDWNILWWHLIWTGCLYVTQVRWWKYVLGVHGSSEGCTWIHSFSEGCVWNKFGNLWLKFFMMTSHMNCMLVCNVGEMMKICSCCTWLLRRMYWVYMVPQKDVLGYIAFQRNVLGIGLKTYDWNFFMMTSHMNYMLVCNAGEMMKICTGCTWILGRMYLDT